MRSYETTLVNAWGASAWWSAGIVLGLAAGIGFLSTARRRIRAWRWGLPVLALAGLVIIVCRRLTIGAASLTSAGWQSGGSADIGDVVRDDLVIYHAPGRDLDVAWGFPAGAAVMLLLLLALVAGTWRARTPSSDPDGAL
ncbi:hypothetical protein [Couchioplanes azureus]|uniref:hypothetical protein n=1 Tax=Couchioplanes caeruleus TaxID=56438 RepID=UPI00166FB224|nr:hypothetical protein [Couchioplanes caeruleus]